MQGLEPFTFSLVLMQEYCNEKLFLEFYPQDFDCRID
jgi:hypothetical protein